MKLSAVPCAQYCNPLVRNQQEYDHILSCLREMISNGSNRYAEIRTTTEFTMSTDNFGEVSTEFLTYRLNLENPIDDIRNNFHKSCIQRVIKKSYSNGLQVSRGRSEKNLKTFYYLYLAMRKRKGILPQPYKFFRTMWKNLSKKNHIELFICKKDNVTAAAILNLYFGDTVIYEYGASRPEMLKYGVSHILLWEAIKHAYKNNYKWFDFGRTSYDNEGLLDFKSRWGTDKIALPYYVIPKNYNMTPLRSKKILNVLMYCAVKYLPTFTCRVMGRTLYPHIV